MKVHEGQQHMIQISQKWTQDQGVPLRTTPTVQVPRLNPHHQRKAVLHPNPHHQRKAKMAAVERAAAERAVAESVPLVQIPDLALASIART